MAAPSYTTDLSSFNLAELVETWQEFTGYTAGGAPTAQDTDDPIQGTYHISQSAKVTMASLATPTAPGAAVIPTDGVFLVWQKFDAGGILATFANAGVRIGIGSAIGAFKMYNVGGVDVSPNPYGGWYNYAVDPFTTPDSSTGSPTGSCMVVGAIINLTATGPGKGQPHKLDAIRYGRAQARFTGGSLADGYASFGGFAAQNDSSTNRWGLITAIAGGYRWKGMMVIGSGTACQFVDQNTSVLVDDTRRVAVNFNRIDIRNNSTYINWTNLNFTSIGTVSRGRFEMFDNPPVNFTNCVFTDMDTFIFRSNASITDTTFRRCGQITQGGALIDGCLITACRSHMIVSDPSNLRDCVFAPINSGYMHAIEITSAGEYMFQGNQFQTYGGSGTVNAAIYNNCGSHVTLNITGGGMSPSYRNGTGATTSVMLSITLRMTVTDETGLPVENAYAYIDDSDSEPFLMNTTTDNSGIASTGYSGSGATGSRWRVRKYGYKQFKQVIDIAGSDINLPVTLVSDPQQT